MAPTQIVEWFLAMSLNYNNFQKVKKGTSGKEALREGKGLEVAHIERERIVWREHGAQTHQLLSHTRVPVRERHNRT